MVVNYNIKFTTLTILREQYINVNWMYIVSTTNL